MPTRLQILLSRARPRFTPERALLALAALLAVVGILNPDKITVGDGFGWDGRMYRALAEDFWGRQRIGFSEYEAGRVAPSFVVHYALRALSAPLVKANLLLAFSVLDALLLVASAWLWTRVARRLGLGSAGLWFGFIGAFANFFPLKVMSYYPTLTDVAAFFLGWAMLAAYLRGSTWLLVLVTLVGQFTWPTAFPVGALLLLFPRSGDASSTDPPAVAPAWRAAALALIPALGLGLFVGHAMAKGISWLDRIIPSHGGVAELIKPVWPLSLACTCVYLTVALFVLLREAPALLGLRTYLRLVLRWRTYLVVAVLAGLVLLMRPLARGGPGPYTPVDLLRLISWLSVTAPLKSLVAHAVYFGPVVLVLILGWRAVARSIGAAGPGIVLVAALAITLSLDSESRHLVIFVPFLVSFAAKAVDAEPPSRRNLVVFAVLSLLASKVWLVFGDDSALYLSNIGPWMSHDWYVVDGLVLLVLAGWCARSGVVPRGAKVRAVS